jgi:hypothetical protein
VLSAQEVESLVKSGEAEINDKIETIAEQSDAVLDYSELVDDLKFFLEVPLNLNYATEEDLRKLVFLNPIQIYNLIAYRETYGLFYSIYELQSIEGFDRETIEKILPFVVVAEKKEKIPFSLKRMAKYSGHEILLRYQQILQEKKGFSAIDDEELLANPNSRYLGTPQKMYFRYGYNYFNKIRWGITAEKDAGEVFWKENLNDSIKNMVNDKMQNIFDFRSFHFSLIDWGFLKALTVGDYQLQFGQGLTMWSSLAFGKSSDAVNIKRYPGSVRPYTSTDENRFFRGAAATVGIKKLEISAFYSSNKLDATIDTSRFSTDGEDFAQTIQESGLHRTMNELLKKDAIHLTMFGGNLNFRSKHFKIGATAYYSRFDIPFILSDQLYKQFDFTGQDNINGGVDYSYVKQRIGLFGEVSMSENGGFAQLHGITANLHPRLFITLLYRNYEKDYQNLFSNAFAENTSVTNESGFYAGLRVHLHAKWTWYAYFDQFNFPWLKYRVNQPSSGNEFLSQLDYRLSESVYMYLRYRQKVKQFSESGQELTSSLVNQRRNNLRFHIEYAISPSVLMKNRLEMLFNKTGNGYQGNGFLIFQDVNWKPVSNKFSIYFRYAIFDTDSYDERIYAYENDLLYAFSVPGYYYKGSRGVVMLKIQPMRKISIWLRYSISSLTNRSTIGSGLEESQGNIRSEVKLQIRFKI